MRRLLRHGPTGQEGYFVRETFQEIEGFITQIALVSDGCAYLAPSKEFYYPK